MRKLIIFHLILLVAVQAAGAGQIIQITDNSYDDYNPLIHNGQVVWIGVGGECSKVFYWDGSSVRDITDGAKCYGSREPDIHNGQVVWRTTSERPFYYGDTLLLGRLEYAATHRIQS